MRQLQNVTIEITSKCNFKCRHCCNDSGNIESDNLTKEEIFNIIDELQVMKVDRLGFTGGEPFCDKNLFDYLKYAKDKIKTLVIATNGYLIDDNIIAKLKENNVYKLAISLDGTSAFHDDFRGVKGSFDKAIKAIEKLVNNDMEVKVRSVVTKNNVESVLELMDITNSLNVKRHEMLPVCPIGRANKEMILNPTEYKDFLIKALEKIKAYNKPNIVFQLKPVFYQEELFDGVDERCKEKSLTYLCDAFDTSLEIGTNGDVYGCSFVRIPISNIRREGINTIWHSKEAIMLHNQIMNHNKTGECMECADNHLCNGGCYANKLYGNGVDKKDVYCFVKRRK